jgi:4-hydroxy-tetrahydrodipicolinate reductase
MSIQVMVNGIPGNMGRMVAETCVERGLFLVPYSLTGEIIVENESEVAGKTIQLLKPSNREERIQEVLKEYPDLICIDYRHPSAVNDNAEFYVRHGLPFVMGTTGGDRDALMKLVQEKNHPCIIAPNMAKQIVAFQAMIEFLSKEFPGAFSGYTLSVVESHQKTKADTSGTAKAVVASFEKMGLSLDSDFEEEPVETIEKAKVDIRVDLDSDYFQWKEGKEIENRAKASREKGERFQNVLKGFTKKQ